VFLHLDAGKNCRAVSGGSFAPEPLDEDQSPPALGRCFHYGAGRIRPCPQPVKNGVAVTKHGRESGKSGGKDAAFFIEQIHILHALHPEGCARDGAALLFNRPGCKEVPLYGFQGEVCYYQCGIEPLCCCLYVSQEGSVGFFQYRISLEQQGYHGHGQNAAYGKNYRC